MREPAIKVSRRTLEALFMFADFTFTFETASLAIPVGISDCICKRNLDEHSQQVINIFGIFLSHFNNEFCYSVHNNIIFCPLSKPFFLRGVPFHAKPVLLQARCWRRSGRRVYLIRPGVVCRTVYAFSFSLQSHYLYQVWPPLTRRLDPLNPNWFLHQALAPYLLIYQ